MSALSRLPFFAVAGIAGLWVVSVHAQGPHVPTPGADVILGALEDVTIYARKGPIVALSAKTTSCNKGDKVLLWHALPDSRHPVITLNLYRLLDDRMEQIGQSWVKHGYYALQADACGFGCQANPSEDGLGVGCSDPYGAGLNKGPNLGSRRDINPTTGVFDGASVIKDFPPEGPPRADIRHGLQVREADLGQNNARYFVEGHYIASDDAAEGNAHNNVSYREISSRRNAAGQWSFAYLTDAAVRETPAIFAWPQADFARVRIAEAKEGDKVIFGQLVIGSKVVPISDTANLYQYAVYNMNSNRGVRSFSVPVGSAAVRDIGFSAAQSHGADPRDSTVLSNDPWAAKLDNGKVTWTTKQFSEDALANAIRWGTMYSFWFVADGPPADVTADVGMFKPGDGGDAISSGAACAPGATCKVKGPQAATP
ncbi:MAG: hypothetical protein WDA27_14950 [Actinomycetota bacterium]